MFDIQQGYNFQCMNSPIGLYLTNADVDDLFTKRAPTDLHPKPPLKVPFHLQYVVYALRKFFYFHINW